jgi:tetratricopeptide (TPR) repeat protein
LHARGGPLERLERTMRKQGLVIVIVMLGGLLGACGSEAPAPSAAPVAAVPVRPASERVPVPKPAEVYRDADPNVRADPKADANDPNLARYLDERLAQDPSDVPARVERGYQRAQRGDAKGAEADYARASKAAADTVQRQRYVLWSHGWALLAQNQPEAALKDWRDSQHLHGGNPYWVPYSFAVALRAAGRDDEAVAYYAAAARSDPERWGTRSAMLESTKSWKPHERTRIEAVYALWQGRSTELGSAAPIEGTPVAR